MKTTSTAYQTAMDKVVRNQLVSRIILKQVADAVDEGTFSGTDGLVYSENGSLETGYAPDDLYGTMEPGRYILNGKPKLVPASAPYDEEGFVSDTLSGADGTWVTPPTRNKTFDTPHDFNGLTLMFDSVMEEYPRHIIVRLYRGVTLLDTVTSSSISTYELAIERRVSGCDSIQIEWVNSGIPYRYARLQGIMYGLKRTFGNDLIESVKQTTDIDPITRRLPTETMQFTIFDFDGDYDPENPASYWEYVDEKAPVSLEYGCVLDSGETEWLEAESYQLEGQPSVKKDRATFKATKLLGGLNGRYYKDTYGTKTLYDMADAVLTDAGLPLTADLSDPWSIDSSLSSISTTGVLPIDTHKNCLQLIAHAGRCRVYTDADGIIQIVPFVIPETPNSFTLDLDEMSEKPTLTKTEPLYQINALRYSSVVSADSSTLHESVVTVTSSIDFYAEFELAANVSINVSSGSTSNVNIYGRAITATITGSGDITVTVTGNLVTVTGDGIPYIASDDTRGASEVIGNPLITSSTMKTALEKHMADYLRYRVTYSAPLLRARPEVEAGDLITFSSQYTTALPAIVLRQDLTYNGALKGQSVLKGLFKKFVAEYYLDAEYYGGESVGVM